MIYLDNSATTKPSVAVCRAMQQMSTELFGNPSSVHVVGNLAKKAQDDARRAVLEALGAPHLTPMQENALVFCAGGTEANNLTVFGTYFAKKHPNGARIITTNSEHPSVIEPCKRLAELGAEVIFLSTKGGEIDLAELEEALTPNTVLLSMMRVNNETGAVYDTSTAFTLAKRLCPGITTHSDCVQAFGKVPCTLNSVGAELITLSAHKIHGPKGVGALYVDPVVRRQKRLVPYLLGGGQEDGMRSGTENTVGIAGFGAAAKELTTHRPDPDLYAYLVQRLPKEVRLLQPPVTAPHILSLVLPSIKSETMLNFLSAKQICISAGSACSSHGKGGSPVLTAFGLSRSEADTTVRVSLCADTTREELDAFLDALKQGIETLVRIKK